MYTRVKLNKHLNVDLEKYSLDTDDLHLSYLWVFRFTISGVFIMKILQLWSKVASNICVGRARKIRAAHEHAAETSPDSRAGT
jgi:hypothetical protein